jgi:hypothetical protein
MWKIHIAVDLERHEAFNRTKDAAEMSRYVRVKRRFGGSDLETLSLSDESLDV